VAPLAFFAAIGFLAALPLAGAPRAPPLALRSAFGFSGSEAAPTAASRPSMWTRRDEFCSPALR
jgi:hypothetical protein